MGHEEVILSSTRSAVLFMATKSEESATMATMTQMRRSLRL
jgi:hypothetical protein